MAGCGSSKPATTLAPGGVTTLVATTVPGTTNAPNAELFIPEDLAAFGIEAITVGGDEWLVAVADSPQERADGLRGILEMGDVDGMLFAYTEPTSTTFTMAGVTQPLEIAFFDVKGPLLNILKMTPCPEDSDCPSYESVAPFQWALESFPGGVTELSSDASIEVN